MDLGTGEMVDTNHKELTDTETIHLHAYLFLLYLHDQYDNFEGNKR